MAKELANKQAVIEGQENQLATYYQSILELKEELKMAQQKNDAHIQMQSELMGEKEALKRELEGKVILVEENTAKMVQLNEELEKAKKEIEAHDELKSILLAENEDLKKSNEERSFLNKELALEKIKLEKELMEARSNDQKRSQGHQRLVEELQGEISKALVQNRELKEAVFTITKKNEGLREQLENKVKREKNLNGKIVRMTNKEDEMKKELSAAKDVISSLKKELQRRDLEKVKKEGTGDEGSPGKEKCGLDKTSVVEGCETPVEDDNKIVREPLGLDSKEVSNRNEDQILSLSGIWKELIEDFVLCLNGEHLNRSPVQGFPGVARGPWLGWDALLKGLLTEPWSQRHHGRGIKSLFGDRLGGARGPPFRYLPSPLSQTLGSVQTQVLPDSGSFQTQVPSTNSPKTKMTSWTHCQLFLIQLSTTLIPSKNLGSIFPGTTPLAEENTFKG
ncbi:CAP-Gly domain-containing linker protein 1-like [Palaemon carinicauda]|uniref:CAP-Gly domain-containing linker protein 1-like n=1 Tax=Palaemon carinicauda TaxID=392227 RepID=UPI0035B62AA1